MKHTLAGAVGGQLGSGTRAGTGGAVDRSTEDAGLSGVDHTPLPLHYQQHQHDDQRHHQRYDDQPQQQHQHQQIWHSEPSSASFDRRPNASASAFSNDTFSGDAWGGGGGTLFEKRGNLFHDDSIPPPLVSVAGEQAAGTGGCVLRLSR